jgi:hypothetical protein
MRLGFENRGEEMKMISDFVFPPLLVGFFFFFNVFLIC